MPSLMLAKVQGAFRPVDPDGEDILRRIKEGDAIKVEWKRTRNVRMHRLFFALLDLVFRNQDHYESKEQMLIAFKVALGHCDTVILKTGQTVFIPKSISFGRMGQDEFAQFMDRSFDLVARHFLPNIEKETLRREVERMIAGDAPLPAQIGGTQ